DFGFCFRQKPWSKLGGIRYLDLQSSIHGGCRYIEFFLNFLRSTKIVNGANGDYVAADLSFEGFGRIKGDNFSIINNGDTVTIFGFFHVMRRQEKGKIIALD